MEVFPGFIRGRVAPSEVRRQAAKVGGRCAPSFARSVFHSLRMIVVIGAGVRWGQGRNEDLGMIPGDLAEEDAGTAYTQNGAK